jgi:hypothetical protein
MLAEQKPVALMQQVFIFTEVEFLISTTKIPITTKKDAFGFQAV